MKILLATSNPHKISEIRHIWATEAKRPGASSLSVQLLSLADLDPRPTEPVEDQDTFRGNATVKARHYASGTGLISLADDSGLEVAALGGDPGVRSARYASAQGPRDQIDRANNRLLLVKLGQLPASQRTARFVCAMVVCVPLQDDRSGSVSTRAPGADAGEPDVLAAAEATVQGRILGPGDLGYGLDRPQGRGDGGFGYDPLFLLPSVGLTTAELSRQQKNRISHRGHAARKIWRQLVSWTSARPH